MSTRNRSSYSGYNGRRSGGSSLLRTFGVVLLLGAFSFLLGFFVLSRFVPGSHGPESPSVAAGNGEGSPARSGTEASPPSSPVSRPSDIPASQPPARSASATSVPSHPTGDSAPSIDPSNDEQTQKPAALDDSGSNAARSAQEAGTTGSGNSSPMLDAAAQSPDSPPTHRRRRHRHRADRSAATSTEGKPAASQSDKSSSPAEATQPPARLDDSGSPGTDAGKSGGDN
jgi:hypothetical protein